MFGLKKGSRIFSRSLRTGNPNHLGIPWHFSSSFTSYIFSLKSSCRIFKNNQNPQIFMRNCARQIDYITSQRFRRTLQLFHLYNKTWGSSRLQSLFKSIFKKLFQGSGVLGFATVGLSSNNPNNKIEDKEIIKHMKDITLIQDLKEKTLVCSHCSKRHVIDYKISGTEYCNCHHQFSKGVYGHKFQGTSWTPFLERENVLVWRHEHPDFPGLYIYKMYGKFDDLSADEFIKVQLDLSEYRLKWDKDTAQCSVLAEQNDPVKGELSQIYYWEVNWPKFFSNRDYVCERRAKIDLNEKVAVLYSRSTNHPSCPKKSKCFRVEDYVSVMTIKPLSSSGDFTKKGLEFSLTAFENPGLTLPESITTWVAIRGMPEFMINLHKACIEKRTWNPSISPSNPEKGTFFYLNFQENNKIHSS